MVAGICILNNLAVPRWPYTSVQEGTNGTRKKKKKEGTNGSLHIRDRLNDNMSNTPHVHIARWESQGEAVGGIWGRS